MAKGKEKKRNKDTREWSMNTGLEEQQEREVHESLHDQHLDDDNDGRGHTEERYGLTVQP